MAMTDSGKGGAVFGINVTPLIDVLLVLLIIFMVIVPVMPKGFDTQVPQPPKSDLVSSIESKTVVLTIFGTSNALTYQINQQDVAKSDLLGKLSTIYANRADRTLFIRGKGDVEYQQVAEVVDNGRSAGVDRVAFITPKLDTGL